MSFLSEKGGPTNQRTFFSVVVMSRCAVCVLLVALQAIIAVQSALLCSKALCTSKEATSRVNGRVGSVKLAADKLHRDEASARAMK